MYEGYKIVVVTPAGRKAYLQLLIPQIQSMRSVVDEYRLWVNTTDPADIKYMQEEALKDPDFVKLEYLPDSVPHNGNLSIYTFFKNCQDPKTIYVRFDDDIIYIDTLEAFKNFLQYRIENPQYFLVYATILNNAVISHLLQRMGKLDMKAGYAGYECIDEVGWRDPLFAENIHHQILAWPSLNHLHLGCNWLLAANERVSINCISWLGYDFSTFDGNVGHDEELWLSCEKPRADNRMNVIYGGFACVHYAFHTQRAHMDGTNVLSSYRKLLTKVRLGR
jgi:hypothetical protein